MALASGERQVELLGAIALPEVVEKLDEIHIGLEDWEEEWRYDPTLPLTEKPGRCCKEPNGDINHCQQSCGRVPERRPKDLLVWIHTGRRSR